MSLSNCLFYAIRELRAAWRAGRAIGLWIVPTRYNRWRWLRWPHFAVVRRIDPADCDNYGPTGPKRLRRLPPPLFRGKVRKGID